MKLKMGIFSVLRSSIALLSGAMLVLLSLVQPANALPSYARQTGSDCASCHVGGFGPQLTPYGIRFKIGGYTDSDGGSGKTPLSAMMVANWTRTAKDSPDTPLAGFSPNNNATVSETSVFLAGRIAENVGTFIQATYSGVDRSTSLDQMDVRYAKTVNVGDKDTVFGVSLNSNPTLTDPFNTMGQWRFPYAESAFGFGQGNGPMIENLAGNVIGLNGYAFHDDKYYFELGLYNSLNGAGRKFMHPADGSTAGISMLGDSSLAKLSNPAAYWRFAYFKDQKRDNYSVGLFGFNAALKPVDQSLGSTVDRYQDIGLDASYQYLGNRKHIVALNASVIREWQKLGYSVNNGADNKSNQLDNYKVAASYHYDQTWGVTGSLFETKGSKDAGLFSNANSYANNSLSTSGYVLQADYTPWGKDGSWGAPLANVRFGVQYTGYSKFNGGSRYLIDPTNHTDRKASDNNTLMLFAWTSI
ncbi:MAG: hypothetical protein RIR18_890 [Pseudomonadota bacterium]